MESSRGRSSELDRRRIADVLIRLTGSYSTAVVAGQPGAPVSIGLLLGAIVSGRVRDPAGPLWPVEVVAFQMSYQNGKRFLQEVNRRGTDVRGE